jgi:hypothetical protein
MMKQAKELNKRPHFVVSTPGRLADLMTSSSDCVHFRKLRYLVLDEADRLLEQGFSEHLTAIFRSIAEQFKASPQMLLFSATLTHEMSVSTKDTEGNRPETHATDAKRPKNDVFSISDFLKRDYFTFHADEEYCSFLLFLGESTLIAMERLWILIKNIFLCRPKCGRLISFICFDITFPPFRVSLFSPASASTFRMAFSWTGMYLLVYIGRPSYCD